MVSSVSDIQTRARISGPGAPFPIAPDDATRRMLGRWHAAYGDVYCVPAERGELAHWIVHDPDLVQQVLVRRSDHYRKGMGLDRVKILLGNGIMVSEGDFWARQRRLMQPAFRPRRLADFNALIFDENERLGQRWQDSADAGQAVDLAAHISELTLVIVLKSIFGVDYAQLVAGGANPFALLSEEPERNLRFAARFHRLKTVVEAIIDRRLAGPAAGFDFLGHMLGARTKAGESMDHRALVDEVMTLIVAGHETTASALAWAWYLIATHEGVRRRAQAEADALDLYELRATGGDARNELAFIQRIIDETLRLYPPGWLLSRRAISDTQLGPYRVPAGSQVFISPYVLHRHSGYWKDPQRFDPDRFRRGDQPAHRMAYLPFAAGPRHCVGEHMALTEMRVHLATMLRRFTPRYTASAPPAMASHINLRPAAGIYLQWAAR